METKKQIFSIASNHLEFFKKNMKKYSRIHSNFTSSCWLRSFLTWKSKNPLVFYKGKQMKTFVSQVPMYKSKIIIQNVNQ